MITTSSDGSDRGFSLVEVLVASGILVAALVGIAQLSIVSTNSNLSARNATYASVLAAQKVEELRALTWGFDTSGSPVSDTSSNTAVAPETSSGGTGLSPSPGTALQENTPGYVDYLDMFGNKIAGGSHMPPGAIYTRRWSIAPLPASPDSLVIQVLVTTARKRAPFPAAGVKRLPDDALMVTMKTRKAQ